MSNEETCPFIFSRGAHGDFRVFCIIIVPISVERKVTEMGGEEIRIVPADSEELLGQVRDIFREYQASLGIDLDFQGFEEELASLPGKYAPPRGRLYLAFFSEKLAGCVALRPLGGDNCEMKRLYVRPEFRGRKLGRLLAEKVITEARKEEYAEMYLDTLPAMLAAQAMYRSLGFRLTGPYCYNPVEGTQYMMLDLLQDNQAG